MMTYLKSVWTLIHTTTWSQHREYGMKAIRMNKSHNDILSDVSDIAEMEHDIENMFKKNIDYSIARASFWDSYGDFHEELFDNTWDTLVNS